MGNYETLKYEVAENGIANVMISQPKTLNAVGRHVFEEMGRLLDEIRADDRVRCVVISGDGRAFSAGGNLGEMKEGYGDNRDFFFFMQEVNQTTAKLVDLPKPVIAKVHGAAMGAGMNIVLSADIAVAADDVKFSELFGNVGLIPDCAGTYLLARTVGRSKAKEIIFTRRTILADEALELGIVTKVVPREELDAAVQELAEKIAEGPTFAFALGKQIINRSFEIDLNTALAMEGMAQAMAGNSQDHKEGVAAFFEKRKADFQGK